LYRSAADQLGRVLENASSYLFGSIPNIRESANNLYTVDDARHQAVA
jgi:hypothetical protein